MKTQGRGPVFQVSNLDDPLKYYQDVLGFKEDFQFGAYAGISHGDGCVHLCAHRFHQRPVGGGTAFVFCDEVDEYFQEIKEKGAIVKLEPADQDYGMRDFVVRRAGQFAGAACLIRCFGLSRFGKNNASSRGIRQSGSPPGGGRSHQVNAITLLEEDDEDEAECDWEAAV